ncbi:MAG: RluA family pseudouridine synthase [Deltaproteobacteria bacterium]|nr:RluA family pseudouridine synthase [Deltaproteobacteria bacterium]
MTVDPELVDAGELALAADEVDGMALDERDALVSGELDAAEPVGPLDLPPGADPSIDWGVNAHLHPDGSPRIVERHLVVPAELAGLRLDHFVKTQITRLSRTRIQSVIETQLTRVTPGGGLKPSTTVAAGDHFVIRRPARPEPPCPRTFTVVATDPRFYVIDKPALLPVHASAKFYFNTLTRVMAERFPDEPGLQICHRLDRETSGCLVVARDRAAAISIKGDFATKDKVKKEYLAVVDGQPPWPESRADGDGAYALLDTPLRLSQPGDPTRLPHVRMLPGPGGLTSLTRVRVERRTAARALVRCLLLTGRQHQIRAHLAHAGFPIVGDKLYAHGDEAFIRFCDQGLVPDLATLFVLPRHALHAARVTFPHPEGGRLITAEAPLPLDLAGLL